MNAANYISCCLCCACIHHLYLKMAESSENVWSGAMKIPLQLPLCILEEISECVNPQTVNLPIQGDRCTVSHDQLNEIKDGYTKKHNF